MTYIPGDYWAICQRTGIKFRISELREEPSKDNPNTGNWVYERSLDPVHPQEYVRGVEDDPSVPLAFPSSVQEVGETTLGYTTPQYSKVVVIPKALSVQGDPVGVTMNDSLVFWDFVQTHHSEAEPMWDVNGSLLYASDGLLLARSLTYDTIIIRDIFIAATAGNTVYLPAQNNEEWQ
jgi:hypothetical protein